MVVAEDAAELPGAVFEEPEHGELGLAGGGGIAVFEEAMGADFDGAEVFHGVDGREPGVSWRVAGYQTGRPQMFLRILSVRAALPRGMPPWSW